ncbi:MAG: SDR family oxidoreductase [Rhodobacteraceae bacterium]|nr:SDR family oxidoreductase [Paracoccaceae bacterium]
MRWPTFALLLGLSLPSAGIADTPNPLVLVAGATGATGQLVVALLQDKGLSVRGLVRDPSKANENLSSGVDWVVGDARDPASLESAFDGVTHAVSTIGSRMRSGPNSFEFVDWEGNRNLIDAAKAAGVAHFVLMTSGSAGIGSLDDAMSQRFGAGRIWKGKAESHLRESQLSYTIVAPGGLRNYPGGEKDIILKSRRDYTIGAIARGDVASVIVECLFNAACAGKTITVVNADTAGAAWRENLSLVPADTPDTITGTYQQLERSLP